MNTLLLDFFNKYLKGKDSQVINTDDLPDDVFCSENSQKGKIRKIIFLLS